MLRTVLAIVLICSIASPVARQFGVTPTAAAWLGAPAVLLSGWAALGHIVTLDDDFPGECSNPSQDKAVWRRTLAELFVELLVLAVVALVVFFPFLRGTVAG